MKRWIALHTGLLILLPSCCWALETKKCSVKCENATRCISARRICDGRQHCSDGSDEKDCLAWTCVDGMIKCLDGLQCIRTTAMCDGFRTDCADGSDEDEHGCRLYQCPAQTHSKCNNGVQCAPRQRFCDKRARGSSQYQCADRSDESVWGCSRVVGKNCSVEEGLWPCSDKEDAQCIAVEKVCDGHVGLRLNNCEGGEDEEKNMCRGV